MVATYHPTTLSEALEIMATTPMVVMAGGTDLMVRHRNWSTLAPKLSLPTVFVSGIDALHYVTSKNHKIHIGATTTLEAVLSHDMTPGLLKEAISLMASPAIRHTGTLAGNIGNASPAGDSLPVLYILNAMVVLVSVSGERVVPIQSFITGPGKTVRRPDELIKEIIVDDDAFSFTYFKKVGGRQADAISKVCMAGAAVLRNGLIEDFRVAFGAVGPTIVRVEIAEQAYIGKSVAAIRERIGHDYDFHIKPIDDQRSNAKYRKEIAINMLYDFIDRI